MADRDDVIEAARWLAEARKRAGATVRLVANMATLLAGRDGSNITIHPQQISEIEKSDGQRGLKKPPSWFRYVREAFESGLIAEATGTAPTLASGSDEIFYIHDRKGELVGQITWFARK